MRYRLLGRSGLRVSELCLGTMTFGEEWGWGSSLAEARSVYDAFREAGGNFIDTANIYTNGRSEELLGDFMSAHRAEIVLATKYTNAAPCKNPNAAGNQRKCMMESVEASLRRLKTDYIDLYWLHIWDGITPVDEVMRAFDDLVRQGKVLYVAVSDAPAWWVAQANTLADWRGWAPFVALQVEYSLLERSVEFELLPMARALNLSVTAWAPLAGGLLTGKYAAKPIDKSQTPGVGRRLDLTEYVVPDAQKNRIAEAVVRVAKEHGCSAAQAALAWLRSRGPEIIPIIGARKLDQLRDNLACVGVTLGVEHLKLLDEASAIPPTFPTSFYAKSVVRTFSFAGMKDLVDA